MTIGLRICTIFFSSQMLNGESQSEGCRITAPDLRARWRTSGQKPQLVIAADGVLFCEGLRALVEADGRFQVVRHTCAGDDAVRLTADLRPDLLVLDAAVPRFPNRTALRNVVGEPSPTGLLLLAPSLAGSTVTLAVEIAARGLVLKSASGTVLLAAIWAVADRKSWVDREIVPEFVPALHRNRSLGAASVPWGCLHLTPREREIIAAVAAASSNKDIANAFAISETTVKHHLTSIFGKVGVSSRLALAQFAASQGVHPHESPAERADRPAPRPRVPAC